MIVGSELIVHMDTRDANYRSVGSSRRDSCGFGAVADVGLDFFALFKSCMPLFMVLSETGWEQ